MVTKKEAKRFLKYTYVKDMTRVSIINQKTKHKEARKFPPIEEAFPYLKNVNIVEKKLYSSFPTGYVAMSGLESKPFASGGQLLKDDKGNEYSRNLYVRWDTTHHNGEPDHLNIFLINRDHQTRREVETKLMDKSHFIKPGELPNTIFVSILDAGEQITQPLVFLPKDEDREYNEKQRQFFQKMKSGKLTKDDEEKFKKEFDKYADSLQKRKRASDETCVM